MGFIGSRAFIVSVVIGLVLAGSVLALPNILPEVAAIASQPCDVPSGTPVEGEETPQQDAHRHLAWRAPTGDALRLCVDVGSIHIEPHAGDEIEFTAEISSGGTHAERRVEGIELTLTNDGQTVWLAQTRTARTTWWLGGNSADVDLTVRVPAAAAMSYTVEINVGTITADGLRGGGNHSWTGDVGDVKITYTSLEAGSINVSNDVGDVTLAVPDGDGYSLDARTDVGAITYDLPGTVLLDRNSDPPGDHVVAQSTGHSASSKRVDLHIEVDVGGVHVSTPSTV